MPERKLPENNHQLNRRAKDLLAEVKWERDPENLYCLQLVEWAIENDKIPAYPRGVDLTQLLAQLQGMKPRQAMKVLLTPAGGNQEDVVTSLRNKEELAKTSAEDLAWNIADELVSKVEAML